MDALWYKDAVIYELLVRSFFDANGDGYGDFEGLRHKLPYLERLGVDTLWLLPFYESPLRDDGYDISDYYKILPVHGTLDDFKEFLDEAHRKGMRIITELVLNHTSDQHPWFQESRQPGSARRNWYVWSDTPERYRDSWNQGCWSEVWLSTSSVIIRGHIRTAGALVLRRQRRRLW